MKCIRIGMPATVTPLGLHQSVAGSVWQVSPVIDPQTRQGQVKVAIPYSSAIRPGGFAEVSIAAGATTAPMLPQSAVLSDEKGNYVLIVGARDLVERRDIKVGTITDSGVTIAAGPKQPGGLSLAFLLGAELSLYFVWNLFTLVGSLAGAFIPDPRAVGADVVFPLAFLGLLVPLLVGRREVLVAVFSGLLAWGVSRIVPGGLTVLIAGVGGALLGAFLSTRSAGRS